MVYEYSGYFTTILAAPDEGKRDQMDHIAFGPDELAHWTTTDLPAFTEWLRIPVSRSRADHAVELKGKFDGYAVRVPLPTGSLTDLTVELEKKASVDEVNAAVKAAAEGPMKGILKYYDAPIVSSDIVTDPHSSIIDSGLTKVIDDQAKVVSWYDNEWGYSNRLVDLIALVGKSL